MKNSRSLDDLIPPARERAEKFEQHCQAAGIDLLIYCTFRDNEAQAAIYAQGRTTPGAIATNARPGESWHNYRCAFDCVPMLGGKPQWGDKKTYAKMGEIGESLGLEWAGRWQGSLRETAHFQYTGGLTMADLKAGKVPQ